MHGHLLGVNAVLADVPIPQVHYVHAIEMPRVKQGLACRFKGGRKGKTALIFNTAIGSRTGDAKIAHYKAKGLFYLLHMRL